MPGDRFMGIYDEMDRMRESFSETNPDATEEESFLYSFYLDELSLYLKLKQVSEEGHIDEDAPPDIAAFFPEGLSPEETTWLKAALEVDFSGRNALLDELSRAQVAREEEEPGDVIRSLFFLYGCPPEELGRGFQQALIMRAYQEDAPAVQVQVFVALGRPVITQLFITQVGGEGIDLAGSSLDDRPHDVYSFSVDAVEAVQGLYRAGAYTSASGRLDFSGAIARADGRREAETARLERLIREAVPEEPLDLGIEPMPLASRFSIGLGEDGQWRYVAEVCCSLVDGFYFIEVMRFATGDGHRDKRFTQQQYPNGWILQRVRDALFAYGYKPISSLRRRTHAWFGNRLVDTTFGDCLFTARIGYGR